MRSVKETRAGDTIFDAEQPRDRAAARLQGRALDGVRRASIPTDTTQYENLRDALEKLQLNDASLKYEPETSTALGFGFRCGFLGLLHMEIVQERLEREFDLDLVTTVPNVEYHVYQTDGTMELIENPAKMPAAVNLDHVEEPYVKARIVSPGGLHRPDHDARHGAARRVQGDEVPRHDARGVRLGVPARPRSSSTSSTG